MSVISVTSLCTSWTLFGRLSQVFLSNLLVYYTWASFRTSQSCSLDFRLSFISFPVQVIPYCLYNIQVWTLWRPFHDCQCFIRLFFSPNIISLAYDQCACENKTFPNQTLSCRNGMMGLFSLHTAFFYLSPTLLFTGEKKSWRAVEQWVLAALVVLHFCQWCLQILSELMWSRMLKSTDRF